MTLFNYSAEQDVTNYDDILLIFFRHIIFKYQGYLQLFSHILLDIELITK